MGGELFEGIIVIGCSCFCFSATSSIIWKERDGEYDEEGGGGGGGVERREYAALKFTILCTVDSNGVMDLEIRSNMPVRSFSMRLVSALTS